MSEQLDTFFGSANGLVIQQLKEWVEIISHFETANKYEILDESGGKVGFAAEDGGGFGRHMLRMWLKSHRPLDIHILGPAGSQLLELKRPFYFFFSNMAISGPGGTLLGRAKKRFGIIFKKYDLCIGEEQVFARIKAPFWRLWTFPILDLQDNQIGVISKKWGGFMREAFTDADKFHVEFPKSFSAPEKAIALASALSIDLDYFEENAGRSNN